MEFLRNLKEKPPHVKTNVAFGAAFAITLIVALIWGTTLPAKFNTNPAAVSDPVVKDARSPVPDLMDGVGEKFKSIWNSFGSQNEGHKTIEEKKEVSTEPETPSYIEATSTASTSESASTPTTTKRKTIQIATSTEKEMN